MEKIIREIFTIGNIFWIFLSETFLYLFLNDYSNYIKRLTKNLASTNILYVKVFQAIASNNNLIDEKTNTELLKFTDNVHWNYNDIQLYELIEITEKYNLYLKDGYEKPINSGMISLVFKAYSRTDNSPIIIKMKRKNIETKLNNAIENLKTFMYLLSFIPIINKYEIKKIIDKNIKIIQEQTNFKEEVKNIIKMKKNCEKLKYVKIPQVCEEVTDKYNDFIMMEYIEGLKINEINKEDYTGFSKQVLKFGLVTTIVHGYAHGDLHSGNIIFIKDETDAKYPHKIGIIDLGIILELDLEFKNMLFDSFTNIFERTPRESIIIFLNSNVIEPPNIFQKIPPDCYESIVQLGANTISSLINHSSSVNQIHMYEFLSKLNEYLNNSELENLGIHPSDNFVKSQLVLAMAHGVTMTLCKENFVNIFDEVINELFHVNMIM